MRRRRKVLWILLLLSVLSGGSGCMLESFRMSGYFESDHARMRLYSDWICDGRGAERPFLSGRDYFTHYTEFLKSPDSLLRSTAAFFVTTDALISGYKFPSLADAYIVGGRDAELEAALLEAWRREEPNTWTRFQMAYGYLDLRRRQYIWANPDFARSIGLAEESPRCPQDLWNSFGSLDREIIDERMTQAGDETFDEVWRNHLELLEALRTDTLLDDD